MSDYHNKPDSAGEDQPDNDRSLVPPAASWSIDDVHIAHVLFMDIVGYSKYSTDEQTRLIARLHRVVRSAPTFQQVQHSEDLLCLPAGDGMALVFFRDPVLPAKCALEIASGCKGDPDLRLRMGINSGPVYRVSDINSQTNVAGAGINDAQRVMSCADDGHILVAKSTAEMLLHLSNWRDRLHPLGDYSVKHGRIIALYNLYTDVIGNPRHPEKAKPIAEVTSTSSAEHVYVKWRYPLQITLRRRPNWKVVLGAALTLVLLLFAAWRVESKRSRPTFVPLSVRSVNVTAASELQPSVSRDGRALTYTVADESEKSDVFVQNIYPDGGFDAPRNLTAGDCFDYVQPAFSPDKRMIAVRADLHIGQNNSIPSCDSRGSGQSEGIFVINVADRSLRSLTDHGYNPAWSPDGNRIVYASEGVSRPEDRLTPKSALETVDLRTGEIRTLYEGDGVGPAWSPNGSRIAFWFVDRNGHRDIATISSSGEQLTRVTDDAAVDWDPAWSSDGRYLYFSSDRDGPSTLWRIAIDEHTGATSGSLVKVGSVAEDSSHVNFLNTNTIMFVERNVTSEIVAATLDSTTFSVSGSHPITHGLIATRPDLSPDGSRLAFNAMTGKRDDIYTVAADGTGYVRLVSDGYTNRGPRWSPAATQIAYFSNKKDGWQLWTLDMVTHRNTQLTFERGLGSLYPVWAPSGDAIAFTRRGKRSSEWQCFRMRIGERQPAALPPLGDTFHSFTAWAWSPDGKYIAGYLQRSDGKYAGVSVLSLSDLVYRHVSTFGKDPVWLNDSRTVLFTDRGRIWSVDTQAKAPEGTVRQVLSVAPNQLSTRGFAVSRDGHTIYFGLQKVRCDLMYGQIGEP